ncbi:MAG: hypothetical protein HC811_02085 [Flammeovirgaceae bacterium]|nr:hypothetical protein [Flammeovirgaceae bacterium]
MTNPHSTFKNSSWSKKLWQIILLLCFVSSAFGQVTTGGSGNWSSTTINAPWAGAAVPTAGQTVTINSGHTVTLDINTAVTLASITINPGGILITIRRKYNQCNFD